MSKDNSSMSQQFGCTFSGIEHDIIFIHCDCEPLPLVLIRAQLWPASPQYLKLVFTYSLSDWTESLLLECQVALKAVLCTSDASTLHLRYYFKRSPKYIDCPSYSFSNEISTQALLTALRSTSRYYS